MADTSSARPVAGPERASVDRRSFLKRACGIAGWSALTAWVGGSAAATARFFFPRVLYEPPTSFKVGRPEDYTAQTVDGRWLTEYGIYVVRSPKGIYVLRAMCTHLGCNITWFETDERFKCPCHGSFFDIQGDVIGGPAPEPLYRPAIALAQDGKIIVDIAQHATSLDQRGKRNFLLDV